MRLVGIQRHRGQDGGLYSSLARRKELFEAKVAHRLVGVVAQIGLYVLSPTDRVVEVLSVDNLVLIEL